MTTTVRNVRERARYEITIDHRLAGAADYVVAGDTLVFTHTEIDVPLRGSGLGAELVRAALEDARARGYKVVPRCWFVADFVRDHPEYADLLAA